MELYVLNGGLQEIAVIDSYSSLIWTKRYYTYGDFELYLPASKELMQILRQDYYITREDDETVMIIEKIEIKTDIENGDFLTVSGRSIESILARRIIRNQTNISVSNPVLGINRMITENAITCEDVRKLPGLSVAAALEIPQAYSAQFTGTNLLDAVTRICTEFGLGMKIILSNGGFVFSCYEGRDVDVTFSPEFDNLISSEYKTDMTNYFNMAFVAGEGEGTSRKTAEVQSGDNEPSGYERRELYVDARDISSNEGEISDSDYNKKLEQRGREKLDECAVLTSFESEIEPRMTYQYKVDYRLGDIVTLVNEYGVTVFPRITEIIESFSDEGYKVIPVFEKKEVG